MLKFEAIRVVRCVSRKRFDDYVNGQPLIDGDMIDVAWPDGTTTTHRVQILTRTEDGHSGENFTVNSAFIHTVVNGAAVGFCLDSVESLVARRHYTYDAISVPTRCHSRN